MVKMSKEECSKARGLYVRFLDNFARVKTVEFRVEFRQVEEEIPTASRCVEVVYWSAQKERVDSLSFNEGEPSNNNISIQNGRDYWFPGVGRGRSRCRFSQMADMYLRRTELAEIRKRHSQLWERFTHCEFDDGSKGYSRLWNDQGEEVRFETATGMLVEERRGSGRSTTWTYQKVNGLWFPQETMQQMGDHLASKQVFICAALNEPLDESLFDMPPLPPVRERFRAWRQDRKTRIARRDVGKIREMHERFLDNFVRIQTARFHLHHCETKRDGEEQLLSEADVVWVPSKRRTETWIPQKGDQVGPVVEISTGTEKVWWIDMSDPFHERLIEDDSPHYYMSFAGSHLAEFDLDWLRESRGSFFMDLPNWEKDDGSTGFSRIFCPKMHELRFNTATGMLIENCQGTHTITFTYQRISDIWFPLEIRRFRRGWEQTEGPLVERQVVSVVLNEPVDERLFDLDRPFQVQQN
jgi:hypothetical protein